MSDNYKLVLSQLKKFGLLLESDPRLPSVCGLIANEPMRASWWSHPSAQQIFAVNEQLSDSPDVMVTKLISGKVTFVHRRLWRPLYAIGQARDEWQLKSLAAAARLLLKELDKVGSVTTNKLGPAFGTRPGDTVRDLEKRLLIHAEQFHTNSGAHAKLVETWETWARRVGFSGPQLSATTARRIVELRLDTLNKEFNGNGRLPWQAGKARI